VRQFGRRERDALLVLPTWAAHRARADDDLATTMSSLHDRNLVATVHYYSFWPLA